MHRGAAHDGSPQSNKAATAARLGPGMLPPKEIARINPQTGALESTEYFDAAASVEVAKDDDGQRERPSATAPAASDDGGGGGG